MEKEDEQKSGRQQPEGERKFSQQQYDLLKRCSDKKDISEWNKWRANNPEKDILLEGVDLSNFYLEKVLLNTITKQNISGQNVNISGKAYLNKAIFVGSNLQGANLFCAYAEEAKFDCASLNGACFNNAHLKGASFWRAKLQNAKFIKADLQNTKFHDAHLEQANLLYAHLENAYLAGANLKGAEFDHTSLEGSSFVNAIVDGHTLFVECELDRKTDFRRVGLDSARIGPATKQLLEYNIRRKNWEVWYKKNPKMKWLVKPFWLMSDYGLSTGRIIVTFFGLALIFANIYYHCGRIAPPGIVDTLFVDRNGIEVEWWLVPLRSLYFSIVTMTTLGFGDMYANAHSILGHILLSLQVILGYVLLGAVVTRFAVLFTAGGPAGKFSPRKTKETAEDENNKA